MLSSVGLDATSGSVTTSLASNSRAFAMMKQSLSAGIDRSGRSSGIGSPLAARSKEWHDRLPNGLDLDQGGRASQANLHAMAGANSMMRAMVLDRPGASLVPRERPIPRPDAGELLVEIEACG